MKVVLETERVYPRLLCHLALASLRPVKASPFLPPAALAALLALVSHSAAASDSAGTINAKLKAGEEVAWLIEDSTNKDGDLAVLFTARTKESKPAKFPYVVQGEVSPADTAVFDESTGEFRDGVVTDNAVVSLKDKRVLGRLTLGKPEDDVVYFPGKNHGSLQVLWGPEEEGWHFGVLSFGTKWYSTAVLLVESDGERLRQADIKPALEAKAKSLLQTALKRQKAHTADEYAINYTPLSVVDPDSGYSVGDPVTVKIGVGAEIPKSIDDSPYIDATMTVLLETSPEKISAKVLKAEANKR